MQLVLCRVRSAREEEEENKKRKEENGSSNRLQHTLKVVANLVAALLVESGIRLELRELSLAHQHADLVLGQQRGWRASQVVVRVEQIGAVAA
jgi:hypothetical protein